MRRNGGWGDCEGLIGDAGEVVETLLAGIRSSTSLTQPGSRNTHSELFEDQLACADLVVLNKTDLVDSSAQKNG